MQSVIEIFSMTIDALVDSNVIVASMALTHLHHGAS